MSQTIYWTINGVDLETWGVQVEGTSWRAPVSVRLAPLELPGLHGSLPTGRAPVFDSPVVRLELWHDGNSPVALNDATAVVVNVLTQPNLVLRRVVNGASAYGRAELVSVEWGDFEAYSFARATVLLKLTSAFLTETPVIGSDIQFDDFVGVEIPHLAGSTAPIQDIVFRLTGPFSWAKLSDYTSDTALSYVGTSIAAGQYLYIKTGLNTLSAWRNSVSTDWLRTVGGELDVSAGVEFGTDDRIQLWPTYDAASLTRKVKLSASGSGRTTASKIAVRAGRAFFA